MSAATPTEVFTVLADAERAGLRFVLTVRSLLVGAIMVAILLTQGVSEGGFCFAVTSVFLVPGLVYRALVVAERDATWHAAGKL